MKEGGYISIGWPELGDLREYGEIKKTEMRERIKDIIKLKPTINSKDIGKITSCILTFYYNIKPGDIVVAIDKEKVLGIGKVVGGYEYIDTLKWSHCISTEWLYIDDKGIRLPKLKEGSNTFIYRYKDLDNIISIEKLKNKKPPSTRTEVGAIPKLSGIIGDIQNILNRKKQVILYGPPGTGKTYYAEKSCREIAARKMFKKSFEMLTDLENQSIVGNGRTKGVVRICCFHPTCGYEDFIEGIKPIVVNNIVLVGGPATWASVIAIADVIVARGLDREYYIKITYYDDTLHLPRPKMWSKYYFYSDPRRTDFIGAI